MEGAAVFLGDVQGAGGQGRAEGLQGGSVAAEQHHAFGAGAHAAEVGGEMDVGDVRDERRRVGVEGDAQHGDGLSR